MTDAIDTLLTRVRMTAGHLAPVLLTPTDAFALIGEVERLRSEVERLRAEVTEDEGVFRVLRRREKEAKAEERAAVVAYLRGCTIVASDVPIVTANFESAADSIERGEHRREEEL